MKNVRKQTINKKAVIITLLSDLLVAVVTVGLTHYFTIREQSKDYEKMNTYELLYEAYLNYNNGDYLESMNIYQNTKLEKSPEALNNMAYLYSKGLVATQDIQKAKELYRKAYELDNTYIEGVIALEILYPTNIEETRQWIIEGLKSGNDYSERFIDLLLINQYPEQEYDSSYFLNQSKDVQIEILKDDLEIVYEWNKNDIEDNYFYEYLPGQDYKRKEQIGSYKEDSTYKPLYGTVTYKLYRKRCFKNASGIEGAINWKYTPYQESKDS